MTPSPVKWAGNLQLCANGKVYVCTGQNKLSKIDNNRVNKRIVSWGASKSNRSCEKWFYSVSNFFMTNDLSQYSDVNMPVRSSSGFVNVVEDNACANFVDNWSRRINRLL